MGGPPPLPLLEPPDWLAAVMAEAAAAAAAAAHTAANLAHLQSIVDAVNPTNGTLNCASIVDAVIARERGTNPNQVAPATMGGRNRAETEAIHNTTISSGSSFQSAFDAVRNGGPGTIAIVGLDFPGNNPNHVVALVNHEGTVALMEGQNGGEVISDPARANERYNPTGGTDIGWGIVGSNP